MKDLTLIKVMDAMLCSDDGMPEAAYVVAWEALDEEVREILSEVDASEGHFFFPEWHPGIENTLRVDCGSRNEFLKICREHNCEDMTFRLTLPKNEVQ